MSYIDTNIIFESISMLSQFGITIESIPKIIVLGEQNQGKSSLVEALTQSSIFPRCEGLCTRKPFNITMINSDQYKYIVKSDEFNDEQSAYKKMEELNMDKNINCIDCTIISPSVYNCTIVDTIGLIKISEQDNNLDPKKIKEKVIEYLKDKNNIFVLVSSATLDLANSQMLQLIKKYNRTSDTLGVLTKIDLTENQNTNIIKEVLKGNMYKLGYGWIATKLRSDKDIKSGVSLRDSLQNELDYFNKNHFSPSSISEIRKSIAYIQFQKFKEKLPSIIEEIEQRLYTLKSSQNFLDKIIDNTDDTFIEKLKKMVEKLVSSSRERAEFENKLRKKLKKILLKQLDTIYPITNKPTLSENLSEKQIDKKIYDYHAENLTIASSLIDKEGIDDMLNSGYLSQIPINNETLNNAFENDCNLSSLMKCFELKIDDANESKKKKWIDYVEKYFSSLLDNLKLQNMIYETTEDMIIEYINTENDDDVSAKFADYMIKKIGRKVFEEKIRYCINSLILIEKRPYVSPCDIIKQIISISDSNYLDFNQFWSITRTFSRPNSNKIEIELYSDLWNIAYIRNVIENLSRNCYRIVAVTLVDNMVSNLLNMVLELNKEKSMIEKESINEQILLLNQVKVNFSQYINY